MNTLSKNVKLDSQPDFKVTMTKKDGTPITLWEKDRATVSNNHIIQSVEKKVENYEEKVILTFNPDYQLDKNANLLYLIMLPFQKKPLKTIKIKDINIQTQEIKIQIIQAMKQAQTNQDIVQTRKPYVEYVFMPGGKPYKEFYDHPVVQVQLQNLTIKKVDSAGNPLENAKFAIYKENPDENQNVQPLELYDNEDLKGDKKTEFITNDKDDIKIYGLSPWDILFKRNRSP